jgi:hypothetical protein
VTTDKDRIHDVLVVLIVAARVLIWDGAPGQFAETVWQGLVLIGLLLATLERRPCAWGWRGAIAAALVAGLAVAAAASPTPVVAWCRWSGWMGCLAAAGYLSCVIAGRRQLVLAALGAGLAGEALLAITMKLWVMPAMAAAQQQGAAAFAALAEHDVAERIANGGVFGSFTLANQLGIWLVLVGAVLARVWWLAVPALVSLWFTDAKGAWLALVAVAGYAWWLRVPGWWRWLPVALGGLAVAAVGPLAAQHPSVQVRLGYWQGAWDLFREAPWLGHGLGGFAVHFPRVMAVGAEPTQFAHNEVLEGLVSGGFVLGALVLAWLVALAWPRPPVTGDEPHPQPGWLALPLVGLVLYLTVLGALDGNLGWWPMPTLLGGLVVGLVMAGAFLLVRRQAVPPAWQCCAAAVALALGSLIDVHGQSSALWGTLAAVLVLAIPTQAERVFWPTPLLAVALVLAVAMGGILGQRSRQVEELLLLDRLALRDPAARDEILAVVGDVPDPHQALMERLWHQAAGNPVQRREIVSRMTDPQQALACAQQVVAQAPASAAARRELAHRLAQAGDWPGAVASVTEAVRLAPTDPRQHRELADLLEAALGRFPQRDDWHQAAAAARAEERRLGLLVHPRLRAP